jgi:hypothetical protein
MALAYTVSPRIGYGGRLASRRRTRRVDAEPAYRHRPAATPAVEERRVLARYGGCTPLDPVGKVSEASQRAASPPSTKPVGPSGDGEALSARLAEIVAATPQAIDALEPSLRAILDATGAAGGALCVYDQSRELLRLAAEVGLSDEGCRRLRTIRRGDTASWDMPLHGLINRRAYLIESAAKNRYVPPLVETTTPVRTVACLPMYVGAIPVASLILIALSPCSLGEQDIRLLDAPLRELARVIEAFRRQASEAPSSPPTSATPPPAPAPRADTDGSAGAAPAQPLATALTRLQRENVELRAELDRVRDAAADTSSRTAEVDRLRARLAEAEAGAAHEQRVREKLEAALERGASAGQHEFSRAVEAARQAEVARAAMAAETVRLSTDLEQAHANAVRDAQRIAEQTVEVERLQAEAAVHERRMQEALEATRLASAARDAALAELAAAREERAALEGTVAGVREDAAHERDQLLRLQDEERGLRAGIVEQLEHVRGRTRELETELATRVQELGRARAEQAAALAAAATRVEQITAEASEMRARLAACEGTAHEHEREAQALRAARDVLAVELEQARTHAAELETELEGGARALEELRLDHAAELTAAGTDVDRLTAEATDLRVRLAAREDAAQEQEQETQTLRGARDALAVELEQARARAQVLERERAPAPPAPSQETVIDDPEPPLPTPAATGPSAAEAAAIVVLDADTAWDVPAITPDEEVANRIDALAPAHVLVNLACPNSLTAAATLRGRSTSVVLWGCVAEPARARMLLLGPIEPLPRPIDPDAVLPLLQRHGVRGARVLTVGEDVDTFISLRHDLTRQGMSVSMAWNAKQVGELLPLVRPGIVVLDLELAAADTAMVAALLAATDPPPATLLVMGRRDHAPAFAPALREPTVAALVRPLAEGVAAVLRR